MRYTAEVQHWWRAVPGRIVVLGLWGLASPVAAQSGGQIQGAVIDQEGQTVSEAIVVVSKLGATDNLEAATSAAGTYLHAALEPGLYTVTASKGDLGAEMFRVRVREGQTVQVNLALEPGRRVSTWLAEAAAREALAQAFNEGVVASREGRTGDAIAAYDRALALSPSCLECNFNLAVAYGEANRLAEAEATFQRVLRIRPDYAAAYYGLSSIFTRQGRTEDAVSARNEANRLALERLAQGRARAEEAVTRGLTFLNAGNLTDALGRFEAALEDDPNFAPAHYWLGTTLRSLGRERRARRELERYLQLDATGEFADEARDHLDALR